MAIDTLAIARDLETAGIDRGQAEAHAQVVTKHVLPNVATPADIDRVTTLIEKLELKIDKAELRIKLVVATAAGAVIAAIKFFPP